MESLLSTIDTFLGLLFRAFKGQGSIVESLISSKKFDIVVERRGP